MDGPWTYNVLVISNSTLIILTVLNQYNAELSGQLTSVQGHTGGPTLGHVVAVEVHPLLLHSRIVVESYMDGSWVHSVEVNTSSPGKKGGKEGRREGGGMKRGREAEMKREGIVQRKKREE